jgi:mRNA degradation ribonuclease J1/J2
LVKLKLEEHNILHDSELHEVEPGNIVKLEYMSVEFIRNTHSIPDSCALAIHTPIGKIVHTGDFKIDYTPMDDKMMDLERLSKLGGQGVLLLLADSTNVERPGYTLSERAIGETFRRIFARANGRVIVATFASNIHRMQQIVDASVEYNRKIAFSGRSMEKVSQVGMELGYLHIPEG